MGLDKPYADVPGTTVFDTEMARRGYHINQFAMSLMHAENRSRFLADQRAYLAEWDLTEEQVQAVVDQDLNALLAMGGNIYFLAKLGATHQRSFLNMAAQMTGVSEAEYTEMMLAGGRSPDGNRYSHEWDDRAGSAGS